MKINYNSIIKVKLSDKAKEIFRNKYKKDVDIDEKGFSKFQLWWFMYIFGPHMVAGSCLLEDGCIYIKENDLENV